MGAQWDQKVAWLNRRKALAKSVALTWDLPFCLAPAVAMHESASGTSALALEHHNEFGQRAWAKMQFQTTDGYLIWPTYDHSWHQFGRDLRKSTLSGYVEARRTVKSLQDRSLPEYKLECAWIEMIAATYCPDDPGWVGSVLACLRDVWVIFGVIEGRTIQRGGRWWENGCSANRG